MSLVSTKANMSLERPFLTTADLQRIMGVGESTVLQWNRRKEIAYFRKGKLIRYTHSAVLEFIIRNTVRARGTDSQGHKLDLCPLPADTFALLCERVSRLVVTQLSFGGGGAEAGTGVYGRAA
jgi:hypothetical protein